jgi:chorismate mutase/prephenate dehydratase
MNRLDALRDCIDSIDKQLLQLLNQRAAYANQVGELKRSKKAPIFRPEREAQVIKALQKENQGLLRPANISTIWREIMSSCRSLEAPQRIAFLGPSGTFTEEAALGFFGSSIEKVCCTSIDEVFRIVETGGADYGVVAIENSTEGVVTRTLDLFLQSPVHIIGEFSLTVRHNLLRLQPDLKGIKVVYAHPQALAQCQSWLSHHLPKAERHAVNSNAQGAALAKQDHSCVAIASTRAADSYGLHVVAKAIQDESSNRTRFVSICLPQTLAIPEVTGKDCTSLVVSVPNKPGAVYDMLTPLKRYGVSMTRLESRPAKSGQWDYYFYIDIQGHTKQPQIERALQELKALCVFFKFLGSYPQGDEK